MSGAATSQAIARIPRRAFLGRLAACAAGLGLLSSASVLSRARNDDGRCCGARLRTSPNHKDSSGTCPNCGRSRCSGNWAVVYHGRFKQGQHRRAWKLDPVPFPSARFVEMSDKAIVADSVLIFEEGGRSV